MKSELDAQQMDAMKSRVTYIAALVNLFLSVIKIGMGIFGQSAALIADGIHSLSDLISDALVLIAIKLGSREADHDHPYGHRRFETLATVILGTALIVVAVGIAWDVWHRFTHPELLMSPNLQTLGIALVSILANEWLYHYTKRVAQYTRSKLLLANAWHHRSDAISSVVVLFGIGAVLLGYPLADAIAAVIVALMVGKIGLNLVLESIKELVDTSLPDDIVAEICTVVEQTEGVRGVHLLRSRQMGEDAYIDAHIVVNPRISVSEGHIIGDHVHDNVIAAFDDVVDVLVHIDPEDDEYIEQYGKPLSRQQIMVYVNKYLAELSQHIQAVNLHYLEGGIEIDIIFPHTMITEREDAEKIKQRCRKLQQEIDSIVSVLVYFKI